MINKQLNKKKVAILATDGFQQDELFEPKAALERAGAEVQIVSLKKDTITASKKGVWEKKIDVDLTLDEAKVKHFDALMLPGGSTNAFKLRDEPEAVEFVKSFADSGKPIAAICHAPALLIKANIVHGKKLTSWPSLKSDLINAGAQWMDEDVVVDKRLVTSRKPADIPAFNKRMIELFSKDTHIPIAKKTKKTERYKFAENRQ